MNQRGRQDRPAHNADLLKTLVTRFDEGELRTLCYQLQLDYADLPGEGKANKARELLLFLQRHDRLPELIALVRRERPDIPWPDISLTPPTQGLPPGEFVNRDPELGLLGVERLRAARSPYVLVSGPAGYGKSTLLLRLFDIVNGDATLRHRWSLRYVTFGPQTANQITHVLQSITGRQAPDDPHVAIALACDYLLQELTVPLGEGRRALLLIFDSVERLTMEARQWLYRLLIELRRRVTLGSKEIITVRMIIAGRDVETFWDGLDRAGPRPPAPQRLHLSPFDHHPIRELIWNQMQMAQIDLDDQTVNQIANEVQYLGGGHPQVIRSLVVDLSRQAFAIGPVAGHFDQHRQRLIRAYVSPVADDLLTSLDPTLQAAARVLSVFRRVNANTLQALVKASVLPPDTNELALLGRLQSLNLLRGPRIQEPFYHDPVMRRICALDMAHGSPESRAHYQRLNAIALQLYSSWIHNPGQGLPDTPLKATQRLLSVVEWLFHALQHGDLEETALRAELQGHIQVLSKGDESLSVADLIAAEIRRDPEVRYLLRQRLGDCGFSTVCSWLDAL